MAGQTQAKSRERRARSVPGGGKAWLIAVLGGGATAGAAVAMLAGGPAASSTAELSVVPAAEIAAAAATLTPGWGHEIFAGAKNCVAPMAFITLAAIGDQTATVRIRSGGYLSPRFQIDGSPKRIAIPLPAPYPEGRGVLAVEGDAGSLTVSLAPSWRIETLKGALSHPVVWKPGKPC